LLRRRQTAIKAYLTRADEIQQFNPSEFKSAAR
jgi:hypothetical protein